MGQHALQEWLTFGLSPSITSILVAFLLVLSLPLLQHIYLYRTKRSISLPAFLLVGPSGSGKTSLLTLVRPVTRIPALHANELIQFERGSTAQTHISQAPLAVECSLPVGTVAASNKYRSVNDPSNQIHKPFLLVDTPGHGKLRHFALNNIVDPQNLKGIIFMVDATTLSSAAGDESENSLAEAAEYLHEILLSLQKRHTTSKSSKGPGEMPVLIAPNKLDLFTALPTNLVKDALESEITKLRNSRSKGLMDSGVGMDDDAANERETLGGGGEGKFEFGLMEEYNIPMQVIGGSVVGTEGANAAKWWEWIGNHL